MTRVCSGSDASTKLTATINKFAIKGSPENPYLAHRLVQESPIVPENDRLFEIQKTLVDHNDLSLDLMTFKFNGVKRSTARRIREAPAPTLSTSINSASTANAAAYAQNELGKLGLKSILPLLERRPADVGLLATIVQLYLLTKNHGAAIKVVEAFLKRLEESTAPADLDVRFAPGLVALAVSLFTIESRRSHIRTELAKAASYWRHRSRPPNPPPALLRFAGLSLLEQGETGDQGEAKSIFETLHKLDAGDKFAAAGLLASSTDSQVHENGQAAAHLTPISRLTAGINVDALEKAGVAQVAPSIPVALARKRAAEETTKPAKKRIRKSRLSKDHDTNKTPDPERWLPLRDRSSYRPKGKKGKQKQAAQTQGATEKTEGAATPTQGQAKAQVVSGGGGGQKPKKKKGKK